MNYETAKVLVIFAVIAVIWFISSIKERQKIIEQRRKEYEDERNEHIERISLGVMDGVCRVFSDKNFINALHDGVKVELQINIDGSQNIVITGDKNTANLGDFSSKNI